MTIDSYQSSSENKENIMEKSQEHEGIPNNGEGEPFYFEVPESLKLIAERDNSFVCKNKRLLNLPANPNVVTILEGYVKNFSVNILCCSTEKSKPGMKPVYNPEKNINLCKEIMSDLRIMFDSILPTNLLYVNEREQYKKMIDTYRPPAKIEHTPMPSPAKAGIISPSSPKKAALASESLPAAATRKRSTCGKNLAKAFSESGKNEAKHIKRRSLRNQSSITLKDLVDEEAGEINMEFTRRVTRSNDKESEVEKCRTRSKSKEPSEEPGKQSKTPSRHTRSTKDKEKFENVKPSLDNNPLPSPSPPSSPVNISPPRLRSNSMQLDTSLDETAIITNNETVTDVMQWKIIPISVYHDKPPIPSIIYGAPHLLRLFAVISDYVSLMPMSNNKRDVLARHLELLLAYLRDRKDELFPDCAYNGHSNVRTRRH